MAQFQVLNDKDVAARADMPAMITAIERAFQAMAEGRLIAPPRHWVEFEERGKLVFTVGGIGGDAALAGFRVYDTFAPEGSASAQVVAVWDSRTGAFKGVVVGKLLGAIRTGAIGGMAIKTLARANARVAAVIGSGVQARMQARAAAAVRPLGAIRVYSRSRERRERFAADLQGELALEVRAYGSAEQAVGGADIVICATDSMRPVIKAEWLAPGAHVTTLGPKLAGESELSADVADRANVIASDSLAQVDAYEKPYFLANTPHRARMVSLADIVAKRHSGRVDDQSITLFCSVGLAGTEVVVADAILAATARQAI